ncbi:mps-1, partial [Pristionchus pacificus]
HSVCKEASRIVSNSTNSGHHSKSNKDINLHIVHDSADEAGRIAYTVSILLIFSLIIIVLMFRSIKRSSSTVEMEALLDAMRFREELDLQQRQKRRLMKAKTKVTAWLTRANQNDNRGWKSTPALLNIRKPTTSSMVSEVPEIVVTEDIHRSHTPALSLIYNFEGSGTARSSVVSTGNSLFSTSLDSTCSRKRSLHPDFHSNSLPDA